MDKVVLCARVRAPLLRLSWVLGPARPGFSARDPPGRPHRSAGQVSLPLDGWLSPSRFPWDGRAVRIPLGWHDPSCQTEVRLLSSNPGSTRQCHQGGCQQVVKAATSTLTGVLGRGLGADGIQTPGPQNKQSLSQH